ncbi:acyl-homoserine-lactone synthase [Sphingobium yanoikuyae]|uniref:Acyl-homoserine-lactone synthase n=1 Tax=Sphingobium yanoikuyae TaxID=13690 RepID=A0A085K4D5_SPHYA|nr:acyl-homoserine-lactone synthase [Sphingobium yanoikuyae]AYO78955.1 autoinducer synthase [Sphingobium yanoikuyae]KFD27581.1 autoinducer synthase [Sphingobium yanoikuyae]MDV3480774.1 acyl-homoserine-lactone synthase [Sphingobium yanoikuyae]
MPAPIIQSPDIDEVAVLRAMFEARKRVFIDLLKWDLPVLADRYEIDHFDNPDAQYLVLTDTEVRHRASTRLLPTDRPHILADLFPHLCAGPVPTGEHVREITRFCLDRDLKADERRAARNQLVTALVDHALANDIRSYTGVADRQWFEKIRTFGWQCEALGQPLRYGSQELVALHIHIDAKTPIGLQRAGIHMPLQFRLSAPRHGRRA